MGQLNYTTAELDAMLAALHGNADTNFRVDVASGGVFQLKNTTDAKYHTEWLEDDGSGSPVAKIAETGEA